MSSPSLHHLQTLRNEVSARLAQRRRDLARSCGPSRSSEWLQFDIDLLADLDARIAEREGRVGVLVKAR